ncbi:uroporphyrinogen decarboxylase [Candidatus Marinamargulisbacteria bacterium SCGC AG-439-L15]|nr:uroporphyrinogen decarboxylase [Candidatus Marinamargulisbacteria bacterium SCGC AG-439-L15]
MKNSLFIRAARGEQTERPPIWVMRQAGRYLPEYRKVREKHRFLEMIHTPEIACEVTLQPIDRYGMDAAILFSDILVTASAMGMDVDFIEGRGPVFETQIRSKADIDALSIDGTEDKLSHVMEAIRLLIPELQKRQTPLIGFVGAPFTVASYMIEGGSSPDLNHTREMLTKAPEQFHRLMEKLTTVTCDYALAQAKAGISAFQVFDTWACHLSNAEFEAASLPYINTIVSTIKSNCDIPVIVFSKASSRLAPLLATTDPHVISVDWECRLSELRQTLGKDIALQGNLNPELLFEEDDILEKAVRDLLHSMKNEPGYIFNLGHGMMPKMNPEKLKLVVELVKNKTVDL